MARPIKALTYWMKTAKRGEVFYSDRKDKDVTAFSSHNDVKVATQIVLVVEDMKVKKITKITKL